MDKLMISGVVVIFLGVVLGGFLMARPESAIEFQRKFYFRINWRIEPVSVPFEIRNTRLMGAGLLAAAVGCAIAMTYVF